MAKLSLSEVSKQFNLDRSTIYRAVRNGRLSRSSDGQFDIAEVIRCFGEPDQVSKPTEPQRQSSDAATQKLIAHLENEVKKYQEREERLMQQIDRMQTLIELKTVAPATVVPQHETIDQATENKKHLNKDLADIQQNTTAHTTTILQRSTLQNVAVPQAKKRILFDRVLHAVLRDD